MDEIITDYATGMEIPNAGPEGNRQLFEKKLVEEKGYSKQDIRINEPIEVMFKGEPYTSTLDLVVFCKDRPVMAARCIAGSLGSYEREILAGARLVYDFQIPFSVSTNGTEALVRDTLTGKPYKEESHNLDAVPSKAEAETILADLVPQKFPEDRKEREMIIFRSYNIEKINKEC